MTSISTPAQRMTGHAMLEALAELESPSTILLGPLPQVDAERKGRRHPERGMSIWLDPSPLMKTEHLDGPVGTLWVVDRVSLEWGSVRLKSRSTNTFLYLSPEHLLSFGLVGPFPFRRTLHLSGQVVYEDGGWRVATLENLAQS